MRIWTRAQTETVCGGVFGHRIQPGEPMQVIKIPSLTHDLHRCALCADSPVPPDLPELVFSLRTKTMTKLIRSLPADFKLKQAGQ